MLAFSTSLSALRANQVALNTIANNIANAGTEGYHRQEVQFVDRPGFRSGNQTIGTGVSVDYIRRSFNAIVESSLAENQSLQASVNERLRALKQVETILGPGQGSLNDRLNGVFSDLRGLETEPDNASRRQIAVGKLQALTDEINIVSARIHEVEKDVDRQIKADINEANNLLAELFDLNRQIKGEEAVGRRPNDLLDRFYQKTTELSRLTDIQTIRSEDGGFSFQISGSQFFFQSSDFQLEAKGEALESTSYHVVGSNFELQLSSGRLEGLQRLKNVELARVRERLDTFTNDLVFHFDQLHSTGIPLSGEFDVLNSTRSISNTSLPISQVSDFNQLQAGSLFVAITNATTGERTLEEITFDPATQSLDDLAGALDSIPNLNASVAVNAGRLNLYATNNYRFDFAGRLPTGADLTGISGTSVPGFSGSYTGAENEEFQFTFSSSGTVGVTAGLTVDVTDSSGEFVGSYPVGSDYEPGSAIEISAGVQLSLSSGTVVAPESFTVNAVQEADETGVLAALGINSIFVGSNSNSISVRKELIENPGELAFSRSGDPGNGGNLDRFARLRNEEIVGGLSITFEQYAEQITLEIAQEVSQLTNEQTNYEIIGNQLKKEIDSISGVDPNEEMVFLLQYQKAYEASVRVISTIDQVLTDLFSIR